MAEFEGRCECCGMEVDWNDIMGEVSGVGFVCKLCWENSVRREKNENQNKTD